MGLTEGLELGRQVGTYVGREDGLDVGWLEG